MDALEEIGQIEVDARNKRYFAVIIDAERKRVGDKEYKRGKAKSIECSFDYRLGDLCMLDPEIIQFYRKVAEGDPDAHEWWMYEKETTTIQFGGMAFPLEDGMKKVRNNCFNYRGISLDPELSNNAYYSPNKEELPVLLYNGGTLAPHIRAGSGYYNENDNIHYFLAHLYPSEIMIIDGTGLKEVQSAITEIEGLCSGIDRVYREQVIQSIANQWNKLSKYDSKELPPYKLKFEVTHRSIPKSVLERRDFWRNKEQEEERMRSNVLEELYNTWIY